MTSELEALGRGLLVSLQERLSQAGPIPQRSGLLVPFRSGQVELALPNEDVLRVGLSNQITPVARYQNIPSCVVGVSSSHSTLVTVVDAGLLFGRNPTQLSIRSRIIVLGSDGMGYGLLVDRVLDLIVRDEKASSVAVTAAELVKRIHATRNKKGNTSESSH